MMPDRSHEGHVLPTWVLSSTWMAYASRDELTAVTMNDLGYE